MSTGAHLLVSPESQNTPQNTPWDEWCLSVGPTLFHFQCDAVQKEESCPTNSLAIAQYGIESAIYPIFKGDRSHVSCSVWLQPLARELGYRLYFAGLVEKMAQHKTIESASSVRYDMEPVFQEWYIQAQYCHSIQAPLPTLDHFQKWFCKKRPIPVSANLATCSSTESKQVVYPCMLAECANDNHDLDISLCSDALFYIVKQWVMKHAAHFPVSFRQTIAQKIKTSKL